MIDVKHLIWERYIQPLKRKRKDYVGIEFEFPVVHFGDQPVNFDLMQKMTRAFMKKFGFAQCRTDDEGRIFSTWNESNGDDLSYDCSFNTLELSFGVESDMNIIDNRFQEYLAFINGYLIPHDHILTGMGINPNWRYNRNEPIRNGRYRMLFHHLSSYPEYPEKRCHSYPNFGMFSCASQVQLDVDQSNVLPALNTFARLEPFNSLLFSNSYFKEGNKTYYCSRDDLWFDSIQGYNAHNLGMYETTLHSADEIVDYIATESLYCLERDDKYINFAPTVLSDYFRADSIQGEYWNGTAYENIKVKPSPKDIAYHRSYKFEDLTYRGTIEFRSCCEQPVSDAMTVAAYFAGLMQSLPQLKGLLDNDTSLYHHGYNASELRRMINVSGIPRFADPDAVRNILLDILDLAQGGLRRRGHNEEHLLSPLYRRAESLTNPAQKLERELAEGTSKDKLIREYAGMSF